ncbi:MAG TPA: MXAN_2562 family outer membrane beta-barrel protein [Kofleriaceae bacterium]|jgi:hypothetical protein
MRFVLLASLAVSSAAHAQGNTGTVGGSSGTLTIGAKLWLHENNSEDLALPSNSAISPLLYFNYASCTCARPGFPDAAHTPWYQGLFSEEIDATPDLSSEQIPLQILVGTECDQFGMLVVTTNCHTVTPTDGLPPTIASIQVTSFIKPELSVYDLMMPEPANQGLPCMQRVFAPAEYAQADTDMNGINDFSISLTVNTDSQPPPVPTEFSGGGSQNGVHLAWTEPTGNIPDIAYYQALCAAPDGSPALKSPAAPPRYVTAHNLCGAPNDFEPTMATITQTGQGSGVDAGEPPDVPGLSTLDPAYICADEPVATATSIDIKGLTNGTPYSVVLLAIDLSGNVAGVSFPVTFTPEPVTDFWDDVHNRGDDLQGGFCLIAETYGDDNPMTQSLRGFRDDNLEGSSFGRWLADAYYAHLAPLGQYVHGHIVLRVIAGVLLLPLVAFALAWHALSLPGVLLLILLVGFRRRLLRSARARRRMLAFAASTAVLLLAPRLSHAQAPYWADPMAKDDNSETQAADDLPSQVNWHAGFRIGPYIPQIDSKLGLMPGPYEQMFGTKSSWVPMVDIERVVIKGDWGQALAGITVGYMSKTAHPFTEGSDPSDPDRPRSPNDTNTFHLIPFAITASYRFTTLDDQYGVPVVPYLRGGLAYYAWWSTTDGSFSVVTEPDGSRNKAYGASLGVTGSVGIAIRAERIDESAARSMRDGGILHAGFFAELQAASVDGFGNSKKLSLGDNTWFAGADFEF